MMKARESVVSMFDPLRQSSTPPSSPESDKENKGSAFLLAPKQVAAVDQAPLLKRRLIDIGDATIDEENDENTPNALHMTPSPSSRRAPFGEISIRQDAEVTPLRSMKSLTNPPFAPSSLSRSFTRRPLPASPVQDLADDDLDEDIIQNSSPSSLPADHALSGYRPSAVLFQSPSSSVFSTKPLPTRLSPSSPNMFLHIPQASHHTDMSISSSHASFCMKLTSGDSSFNLLNDNISFLANESSQHMDQDSFLMSPVQLTQKSPPPLAPSYSEPDATAPGVVAQTSSHSGSIGPTSVPPLHVVKRVQPPRLAQSSAKASKQGSDSKPHQRVRSSKLKSKGTSQPAFTCDENASAPASVLARALKVSKQNGVSAVLRHEDENICVGTKRSFAEFNAKNTSVDGPRRVPIAKKQMTMAPGDERHCLANSQTAIVKHKPTGLRIPNQNRLGERRLKPTSSASSRLPGPVKIAGLRGIGGLARPPPPHFSKP